MSYLEAISNLLEEPPIVDLVVPPGEFVCVYSKWTKATFYAQASPVTHSHRVAVLSISNGHIGEHPRGCLGVLLLFRIGASSSVWLCSLYCFGRWLSCHLIKFRHRIHGQMRFMLRIIRFCQSKHLLHRCVCWGDTRMLCVGVFSCTGAVRLPSHAIIEEWVLIEVSCVIVHMRKVPCLLRLQFAFLAISNNIGWLLRVIVLPISTLLISFHRFGKGPLLAIC